MPSTGVNRRLTNGDVAAGFNRWTGGTISPWLQAALMAVGGAGLGYAGGWIGEKLFPNLRLRGVGAGLGALAGASPHLYGWAQKPYFDAHANLVRAKATGDRDTIAATEQAVEAARFTNRNPVGSFVADIAKRHKAVLCLNDDEPRKSAQVSESGIRLNGKRGYGGEPFIFWPQSDVSGFCKTEEKPYDRAICEMLLVLSHYIPGFGFSGGLFLDLDYDESDGVLAGLDGYWPQALETVEARYGQKFEWRINRSFSYSRRYKKDGTPAEHREVILTPKR